MYKTYTADDYRNHWKLPKDYTVHGFIVFGTFHPGPYEQLKEEISKLGLNVSYGKVSESPYFDPILEFTIDDKKYWFAVAYGGAMLSEWAHLACLFGSQQNIVIGNCGGLLAEADSPEIVVPTFASADESTTRMYEPNVDKQHYSDEELSQRLIKRLEKKHKVWHGPTVTCQAMMAETWEDIKSWSAEGYYGVEMEAATVFAVSNHFKCSSAALLVISDNLIQEKTVLDVNYEMGGDARHNVRHFLLSTVLQDMFITEL